MFVVSSFGSGFDCKKLIKNLLELNFIAWHVLFSLFFSAVLCLSFVELFYFLPAFLLSGHYAICCHLVFAFGLNWIMAKRVLIKPNEAEWKRATFNFN